MSLDSVADDIREQAREEADEILAEAEAEAESIIAEAKQDAEEIVETREREIERQIAQEREQGLSSANLEAKQLRLRARRDELDNVRDAVSNRIGAIEGDEREQLTAPLLDAALEEFGPDEELIVHGRAEDEDLLQTLTDDDRLTVGDPVECLGGVIVEGTETNVRVDNTFDAILDDVWDDSLRAISDRLFDE